MRISSIIPAVLLGAASLGVLAGMAVPAGAAVTAPAAVSAHAAPSFDRAGIPFGIEVLNPGGAIRGCYQTDGSYILIEHCNFGDGRQQFEAYLSGWYGGSTYTGIVTQGRNYLEVAQPGANGAGAVRMSTAASANRELLFRSSSSGVSVIARAYGGYPVTSSGRYGTGLYSVRATGYGYYTVSLNTFNGVRF
jgi:hypothetical protein